MRRVAVDIGGTFTDLVYLDEESGEVGVAKSSTTPGRFQDGVMDTLEQAGVDEVAFFAHGTTVIINAITERRGARTALITTRGFRDILEIQRGNRPDLYNLLYAKPRPFVPRRLRLEVTERVSYKGEVLVPLDEDDLCRAVEEARRQGAEAVAVAFLHAYANPVHEQRAAEIVRRQWPQVAVSVSHELTREWREYERVSTTVLDAYVKPAAGRYLEHLGRRLTERGVGRRGRYCMQSNGGMSRFEVAARAPINLIESGPVGGVIGAAALGARMGADNLITLDMGGTTAKASLVEGGTVRVTSDYFIERTPRWAGYPVKVPVVDIVEIGAGGGSIAWLDPAGALKVGPVSAGADPGPACYGRGGRQPTLTDAHVIAGRVNPDYFLGGRIKLRPELARQALAGIARALRVSVEEAALGVIRIADASMVHLLKLVSLRRGRDPRDFTLMAFGGGGPMHAGALARELRVGRVVVPPHPGHFSAWGMLAGDLRHDLVQTRVARTGELADDEVDEVWRRLAERLLATFRHEGLPPERVTFLRSLDMRYAGQEHTVSVPVPDGVSAVAELEGRFHELHERLYTFRLDSPVEVVNFRLAGVAAVPKPKPSPVPARGTAEDALKGRRLVDFDELGRRQACVYERARLGAQAAVKGPAIIEEPAASTVVLPGQTARVDEGGALVIEEDS